MLFSTKECKQKRQSETNLTYFLIQNGYVIILFVPIRSRRKQGPSLGKTDTLSHSVTTSYVLPYAFGVWVG